MAEERASLENDINQAREKQSNILNSCFSQKTRGAFGVARIQSLVALEDEVLMFSTFAEATGYHSVSES